MATIEVTRDNFDQTIEDNDIVILDFWAEWCGPCKTFAPTFEKLSDKHDDIVFGKIDTEQERELAGTFGIRSIPTIAVFRDQIPIFAQPGALPESGLEQLIQQIRDLDMEEVREQYDQAVEEAKSAEG